MKILTYHFCSGMSVHASWLPTSMRGKVVDLLPSTLSRVRGFVKNTKPAGTSHTTTQNIGVWSFHLSGRLVAAKTYEALAIKRKVESSECLGKLLSWRDLRASFRTGCL